MAETPNIGLYVIQPGDTETNVLTWVNKMSSTEKSSNMMLLDEIIQALRNKKADKAVEHHIAPTGLSVGDEWDQVLSAKAVAGGTVIRVDNVSSSEHSVPVKATSKNLWNLSATVPTLAENTIAIMDDTVTLRAADTAYGVKTDGNPGLEVGKTYTFSVASVTDRGGAWGWRLSYADGTFSNVSGSLTKTMTIPKAVRHVLFYIGMPYTGNKDIEIVGLQIEEGVTTTAYTHYVPDVTAVEVAAYGKNLFAHADCGVVNGANGGFSITKTSTGYSAIGAHTASCFGVVRVGSLAELGGQAVTISATTVGNGKIDCVVCASDCSNRTAIHMKNNTATVPLVNEYPDGYILALRLYGDTNADTTAVVTYDDIQVEIGSVATEYEPCIAPVTYWVNEAGTCEVTSISPTMTLLTDTAGVRIECECDQDLDKVCVASSAIIAEISTEVE